MSSELASGGSWYIGGVSGVTTSKDGIISTVSSDSTGGQAYRPNLNFNTTSGSVYKIVFTPISITGTFNPYINLAGSGDLPTFDASSTATMYFIGNGGQIALNTRSNGGSYTATFTYSLKEVLMGNHATTNFFGNELVTNGTFEADSNWATAGATLNERSTEQVHSGSYSRKFTVNSQYDGITSDTFTTETGKTYSLSFEIYPDDTTSSAQFKIRRGDNGGEFTSLTGTMTQDAWNTITYTYTETHGGSGAYFTVNSNAITSGTYYIDDVSLKEVGISSTGFLPVTNEPVIPQIPLVKYNEKMLFSDANYVNCGALLGDDLSGGITISLWFNATAIATNNGLFSFNSTLEFASIFDNNKVAWYLNGAEWSKSSTITLGKTYHVVFSLDTNSHTNSGIYINGVKDSTGSGTFPSAGVLDLASTSFLIGRYNSDAFSHDGLIDDVAMFNTTLNSTQIQELFNDGVALDATTHSKSGNLLGYWRNDGVSTWQDRRGWSYLNFDGDDDYVDCGTSVHNFESGDFTIGAWVFHDYSNSAHAGIIGVRYSSTTEVQLYIASGDNKLWSWNGSGNVGSTNVIPDKQWTHVALVQDGGDKKFYINGVLDNTQSQGNGSASSASFKIGYTGHSTEYFEGGIHSVSAYSVAKQTSEILAIFNEGLTGDESTNSGLIGYWKLDNGTTVTDLSGNGNNGTVTGATLNTGNNGNVAGSPDSITIREGLNSNKDGLGFPLTNPTSNVLRLNGIDEYVELPVSKGLQSQSALTLEAWIKCNSKSSAGGIIVKDDTTNRVFNLTVLESSSGSANKVIFNIYSGGSGQSVTSTSVVADGNWHHIVGVFEPSVKQAIYIDGKLETKDTSSIPSTIDLSTDEANTPIRIGSFENNSLYFKGLLDEVKIYNRALTDGEVSVGSMADGEIKKNYKHQKGKHKND